MHAALINLLKTALGFLILGGLCCPVIGFMWGLSWIIDWIQSRPEAAKEAAATVVVAVFIAALSYCVGCFVI